MLTHTMAQRRFRMLDEREVEAVSGGLDAEGPIVFGWPPSFGGGGGFALGGSFGGYFDTEEGALAGKGDGGGGGENDIAAWQQYLATAIRDIISGFVADELSNAEVNSEKQEIIANKFNPANVESNQKAMIGDGTLIDSWNMNDGSIYYDRNRDGTPDERMKGDAAGNVWRDRGDGWQLVRAPS